MNNQTSSAKKAKSFNFWKDNRLAGFFSITEEEVREKFAAWLKTKSRDWVEYYAINQKVLVAAFVAEKEVEGGLQAAADRGEPYDELCAALRPVVKKYFAQS